MIIAGVGCLAVAVHMRGVVSDWLGLCLLGLLVVSVAAVFFQGLEFATVWFHWFCPFSMGEFVNCCAQLFILLFPVDGLTH